MAQPITIVLIHKASSSPIICFDRKKERMGIGWMMGWVNPSSILTPKTK